MKKLLTLVAIIVLTTIVAHSQTVPNDNDTVYITKSGAKYHTKNCMLLKGRGIPKLYSEVKSNHDACAKCYGGVATKKKSVKNTSTTTSSNNSNSTYSGGREIHTGPRGGQYYINSNGKKTYIKRKK